MQNLSGIDPIEFNVLVLPDKVERKTAGGLHLPEQALDREKHQATKGTLVAASPMAFNEDVFPVGMTPPQPGDRVVLALHSGTFITGEDGQEYRLVKDKDVVAKVEVIQ